MILLTKGNQMNNLNTLKKVLEVVIHADREFSVHTALYKIKGLFDGLMLDGVISSDTVHGELILTALSAKRVDKAMTSILHARGALEITIKDLESQQQKLEEEQVSLDAAAIESTCEEVIVSRNDKEVQLQLDNMPKKLGRPNTGKALSSAERSKRARDKKKANKLVTVNHTLTQETSELYNKMIKNGCDLNSIVKAAYMYSLID